MLVGTNLFPKNMCCCKGQQEAKFRNPAESLLRGNQKLNTAMGKQDLHPALTPQLRHSIL